MTKQNPFWSRRSTLKTIAVMPSLAFLLLGLGWRVSASSVLPIALPVSEEFAPPLSFEPNQGQTNHSVKFLARSAGCTLFLTPQSVVITFEPSVLTVSSALRGNSVTMTLVGGNSQSNTVGLEELPGRNSYFAGPDSRNWRTGIPTFKRVQVANVYPGIDLSYMGAQGRLEYEFAVSPKGEPNQITLEIGGVDDMQIHRDGHLELKSLHHALSLHSPVAYQQTASGKKYVVAKYRLVDKHRVGLVVSAYDRSKTLFLGPVLRYSGSASVRRH
jgi:hypothetical protein